MVGTRDLDEILGIHKPEDSFYVYELDTLKRAYQEWTRVFPTIRPFYAVKCNPDPMIVSCLAACGAGFDCASRQEIQQVLDAGVSPDNIIYANPCKHPKDIEYAFENKIYRTTFDSVCELQKIAQKCSHFSPDVILRIRADDPEARCNLGIKYGAEEHEWGELIETCSRLSLNLVGISFHVGSMAKNAEAFQKGIEAAVRASHLAERWGFCPRLIDIGGGFSSSNIFDLGPVPQKINESISNFNSKFEFIAEPGRYFAEHVATLVTPVIGKKPGGITISESLYGAFNCVLFDHAAPTFHVHSVEGDEQSVTVFGSTCDGGDIICREVLVPRWIGVGSWLVWPRMGAYTSSATTNFNGIPFNNRLKVYTGL